MSCDFGFFLYSQNLTNDLLGPQKQTSFRTSVELQESICDIFETKIDDSSEQDWSVIRANPLIGTELFLLGKKRNNRKFWIISNTRSENLAYENNTTN